MPQIPSPYETFDLGGGVGSAAQYQVEAAQGETDTLRARVHADENERGRKLTLFRDVVSGGLHWLLEKVEGPRAPLPDTPRGPLEALMAKAGVNGGRQQVMDALNASLGTPHSMGPPLVQPQARSVPVGTFMPDEDEPF
jgi:hypothetical protein